MTEPMWWNSVVQQVEGERQADPVRFKGAVFGIETAATGRLIARVGEEAWRRNTICEIGSMTKPFTSAAALMALKDRGMLNVDMPVCQIPGMGLWERDQTRMITVRQLLQHRTNLPFILDLLPPVGVAPPCQGKSSGYRGSPGLTNECMADGGVNYPARQLSLEQVSRYVMRHYNPVAAPGSGTRYSNFDHIVAGRIVEMLTNRPLNHYLRDRVFRPLGMNDTFFVATNGGEFDEGVNDTQRARIADVTNFTDAAGTYLPTEFAPTPGNRWDKLRRGWRFVWPEGGIYSTVNDLLDFLAALRDGGRGVIDPQVVRLLVNVHTDAGGTPTGNTLGFTRGHREINQGVSVRVACHLGRFMTYFWLDPATDTRPAVTGVFLSQRIVQITPYDNRAAGAAVINNFARNVYQNLGLY